MEGEGTGLTVRLRHEITHTVPAPASWRGGASVVQEEPATGRGLVKAARSANRKGWSLSPPPNPYTPLPWKFLGGVISFHIELADVFTLSSLSKLCSHWASFFLCICLLASKPAVTTELYPVVTADRMWKRRRYCPSDPRETFWREHVLFFTGSSF